MTAFIKNLIANHKIKTTFVGGVLVVATAYGTCSFDPDEQAIKEAAVKEVTKEEPKKEEAEKEEPKKEEDKEKSEESKKSSEEK